MAAPYKAVFGGEFSAIGAGEDVSGLSLAQACDGRVQAHCFFDTGQRKRQLVDQLRVRVNEWASLAEVKAKHGIMLGTNACEGRRVLSEHVVGVYCTDGSCVMAGEYE